ncbi:MAG TPA: bacteriohopanetetrol glucosamine biosynthesis glycosyltransferase HpnI [Acidobacteriaceae bacterium]|nr:bacteriohopanetetrol glucosamine biosynthesis glycosyltransferase HpnI [Acidobacteriaceae bacterium]
MLPLVIAAFTTFLTCAGLGYYLLALWSARAFYRQFQAPLPDFEPGVSILKPVKGLDPDMYASFASHCLQEYGGPYEILFGVRSVDDPAVAAIEQLQAEFPDRAIRLVLCPELLGANGKVSNLVQMLEHAAYDYVLINDSDITVSPYYLRRIMSWFQAPRKKGGRVGMVTSPYRGRAHGTIGSRMEALGISTDFIAGVLTARQIEGGIHFGLGATLAVSREALEAIGGLAPLVDYLADDYELGARVSRKGFEVALSPEVVETFVPAYRFSQFLAHQIRWSRSTRDSRKLGYTGMVFTYGLPWAMLNFIASGASLTSIALLSMALLTRVTLALTVGVGVVGDVQVLRDLWLLPARDLVAMGIWIWSYAGNTVAWRGQRFFLKDGKLSRLTAF